MKTQSPSQSNIFLVSDDDLKSKALGDILPRAEYRLFILKTNHSFNLEIAKAEPDLVLLDADIADLDVLETCRCFKAGREGQSVASILLIISKATHFPIDKSLSSLSDDYLNFPFEADMHLARIKTHLELKLCRCAGAKSNLAQKDEKAESPQEPFSEIFGGNNQAYFDQVINSLPGFFYVFDKEGVIHQWNANLSLVSGYSDDQIRQMNAIDFTPDSDKATIASTIEKVFSEGSADVEANFQTKTGQLIPFLYNAKKIVINDKSYLLGVGFDISERRQKEQALNDRNATLKVAQHIAKFGAWDWDVVSGDVWWSEGVYTLFGLDPEKFTPQIDSILKLSPEEQQSRGQEIIARSIENKTGGTYEQDFYRPDGSMGSYISTFEPYFNQQGELVRMIGTAADCSDRKRMEDKLRASEARLKDAQAIAHIGSWEFDRVSEKLHWSDEIFQILGIESDQAADQANLLNQFIHPDDRKRVESDENKSKDKAFYTVEHRLMLKSGQIKHVLQNCRNAFDNSGKIVRSRGTLQDITEKKLADEEIIRLNRELENRVVIRTQELDAERYFSDRVVNSLPGIFCAFDDDGKIIRSNRNYQSLVGDEKMASESISIFDSVADDEKVKLGELITRACWDKYSSTEICFVDSKSKIIPHFLSASRVSVMGESYIIAVGFDITENIAIAKELELAKNNAEAANRAKSNFLANMSHEIRTPMNTILGYSQLLSNIPTLEYDTLKTIRSINLSGRHLLSLINDVLDMSKIEAGRMELVNVDFDLLALLEDIEVMLRMRCDSKSLNLEIVVDKDMPRYVCGDEGKLRQLLINLLGNSIKFTHKGNIQLTTRLLKAEARSLILEFEVSDTGVGIAEDKLNHIFEAFSQTEVGQKKGGTGLGLAISKKIAQLMGGDIRAESRLHEGSQFFTTLKLARSSRRQPSEAAEASGLLGLIPGQNLPTVLVADDNDNNRDILIRYLQPMGFEVKQAKDGVEAIALFKKYKPTVVLMDIVMPNMGGIEATKAIRQLIGGNTALIVAITASALDVDINNMLENGADEVLLKPVRLDALLNIIVEYKGLEREFNEDSLGNAADVPKRSLRLSEQDVATLPKNIRSDIIKALRLGNMTQLRELVPMVKRENEALGKAYESMVLDFKLKQLKLIFNC